MCGVPSTNFPMQCWVLARHAERTVWCWWSASSPLTTKLILPILSVQAVRKMSVTEQRRTSSPIRELDGREVRCSQELTANLRWVVRESSRTQFGRAPNYWRVGVDGMPLSVAAVGITHCAIVDTGTSLLTGHTTRVRVNCCLAQWSDHHPVHSRSQRQPQRDVFRRWCRGREGS